MDGPHLHPGRGQEAAEVVKPNQRNWDQISGDPRSSKATNYSSTRSYRSCSRKGYTKSHSRSGYTHRKDMPHDQGHRPCVNYDGVYNPYVDDTVMGDCTSEWCDWNYEDPTDVPMEEYLHGLRGDRRRSGDIRLNKEERQKLLLDYNTDWNSGCRKRNRYTNHGASRAFYCTKRLDHHDFCKDGARLGHGGKRTRSYIPPSSWRRRSSPPPRCLSPSASKLWAKTANICEPSHERIQWNRGPDCRSRKNVYSHGARSSTFKMPDPVPGTSSSAGNLVNNSQSYQVVQPSRNTDWYSRTNETTQHPLGESFQKSPKNLELQSRGRSLERPQSLTRSRSCDSSNNERSPSKDFPNFSPPRKNVYPRESSTFKMPDPVLGTSSSAGNLVNNSPSYRIVQASWNTDWYSRKNEMTQRPLGGSFQESPKNPELQSRGRSLERPQSLTRFLSCDSSKNDGCPSKDFPNFSPPRLELLLDPELQADLEKIQNRGPSEEVFELNTELCIPVINCTTRTVSSRFTSYYQELGLI